MTTYLETPTDLINLVGQQVGTTDVMTLTREQVNLFADATGDHQCIHTDPQRAAHGPFKSTIAHGDLTSLLAPVVISEVLQIRAVTSALNHGLNHVRCPLPEPVDAPIRGTVAVISAQQKTPSVESVFELTDEIDGEKRPACAASVIVVSP